MKIPFLKDFEVHVRLLVALPLIIATEVIIHARMKAIVSQFVDRRVITPSLEERFDEIVRFAFRCGIWRRLTRGGFPN